MKLALVTDVFYPRIEAGAEQRYLEVAKRLAVEHEVHVFTMRWHGAPKEEVLEGVHVHRLNEPGSFYVGGRRSISSALGFTLNLLPKALKTQDFDLIDANQFPLLPLAPSRLFSARSGCPLVCTWLEVWGAYWKEYLGWAGSFGRRVERAAAKLPDHIISISEHTKKRLVGKLGVEGEKVSVIPVGLDLKEIEGIKAEKEEGKLVYVGRLMRHKNVELLLEAMPVVIEALPEAHLRIVGGGPEEKRLAGLSRELGIDDRVEFLGVLDRESMLKELKSSLALVLPSTREGQGLVVAEAMAAGTLAIAAEAPNSAVTEFLRHGENGLLFLPGDKRALSEAILRGVLEEGERRKMVKKGSESAKQFDWERVIKKTLDVYNKVVGR